MIINRDSVISNCFGKSQRQGAIVDVSVVMNGLVGQEKEEQRYQG